MSVLEQLNLPAGFGYLLLVFGLILSLAPWFHGLDFGILKIPQFNVVSRRWLKWMGPLSLALAVGLHAPLPTDNRLMAGPTNARNQKAAPKVPEEGAHSISSVPIGQRFLTTWEDDDCLYPARSVAKNGELVRMRFDFGAELDRRVDDLFVTVEPRYDIGAKVWVETPVNGALAPGFVRDTRTARFLIEFDTEALCASSFQKPKVWLPNANFPNVEIVGTHRWRSYDE